MYNDVLKLKIGRGAKGAAKISKKGFFGQILVSVMLPFCDFEVSVMLPFSKILGHPPPESTFLVPFTTCLSLLSNHFR